MMVTGIITKHTLRRNSIDTNSGLSGQYQNAYHTWYRSHHTPPTALCENNANHPHEVVVVSSIARCAQIIIGTDGSEGDTQDFGVHHQRCEEAQTGRTEDTIDVLCTQRMATIGIQRG
mmetsp:Transcript_40567/g.45692  ORF Transcript_40567/g.45692 Transcript_40567/m.45692 type:complete len:118 (-) Transcript_40567:1130-1483(-)